MRGADGDQDRLGNTGVFVELAVGDRGPLPGVTYVHDDMEPAQGSVLARKLETTRRVGADEYVALLAERLREVMEFGIAEAFLVRSLRDHLTEWHRSLADVGQTSERRADTRQAMLETANDPVRLERYRERLADQDPKYRDMPLNEVAAGLRDMVERTLPEPDADEAAARWASLERWLRDLQEWLPDDAFDAWSDQRIRRRLS